MKEARMSAEQATSSNPQPNGPENGARKRRLRLSPFAVRVLARFAVGCVGLAMFYMAARNLKGVRLDALIWLSSLFSLLMALGVYRLLKEKRKALAKAYAEEDSR
ncbi:MAG: hypothetical protein D6771_02780, partial [Zetaproteobacteria bacterium]